ncbi:uncharacterized protein LOC112093369 [Morus notabilis]|uniref:uncharacterized protein LOC112093369 n=1 Tax=Morus notabilis TaxID=981085 RepID=UPI000CED6B78|nr:uncharacterized protein LOC112093369 [Morus notabilis]
MSLHILHRGYEKRQHSLSENDKRRFSNISCANESRLPSPKSQLPLARPVPKSFNVTVVIRAGESEEFQGFQRSTSYLRVWKGRDLDSKQVSGYFLCETLISFFVEVKRSMLGGQ